MKKVLIVGSGGGGVILANSLDKNSFDITVLDKSALHFYQPWFLYVAFKGSTRRISRPMREILKPHIKFYQDEVTKIDLYDRKVHTRGKKTYGYDYLVIATGTVTNTHGIPGLDKINAEYGDYHTNISQAQKLWNHVQQFNGGNIVLGQASTVCKCPPSMLEGMFLLEEYINKKKLKNKTKLTFFTPFPRAYPAEPINKILENTIKERNIEVLTFFDLDYIDTEKKIIHSIEGDELKYDLPIIVPPCTGVDIEYNPASVLDEDKFLKADKETMRVEGFDDVFAVGDANTLPTSKTGVTAHLEAKVVADLLMGKYATFSGRINCPFDVAYGKATFVIADYKNPVVPLVPTRTKHFMKMMMARIYWATLKGSMDWLFDYYFKSTNPAKLNKKYQVKA